MIRTWNTKGPSTPPSPVWATQALPSTSQERLQAIANEVAAILPRLTGDPKACFLDWLNGGTGTRDTNWHDSKKVVELREERRALLGQYKLRVVE